MAGAQISGPGEPSNTLSQSPLSVSDQTVSTNDAPPSIDLLTPRELEVLRLIAGGLSNREIARKLHVSDGTVKTHAHRILSSLNAKNRTEAAHIARNLGLF